MTNRKKILDSKKEICAGAEGQWQMVNMTENSLSNCWKNICKNQSDNIKQKNMDFEYKWHCCCFNYALVAKPWAYHFNDLNPDCAKNIDNNKG